MTGLAGHDALRTLLTGLLLAAALDTVTGLLAAVRSGTFSWAYVNEWVRSHLLWRVVPIAVAAVYGHLAPEPLMTAAAAAGSAGYAAETVKSVIDNLKAASDRTKGAPGFATLTVLGETDEQGGA